MRLSDVLFSQGFGTRRVCAGLIEFGHVAVQGRVIDDPGFELDPAGLVITVDGIDWPVWPSAVVMLNKPLGYECSQKPKHHPSVMSLLPPPLRDRGIQPIGRLDQDTSGLLLMTDSGPLIHRLTHPKRHFPKTYVAGCARPIEPAQIDRMLAGVVLIDDPQPVQALSCEAVDERTLRLTLAEGKYHQVRRMIAAVGNHCETLHRSHFGALTIPADLAPGQWRWLDAAERAAIGI